MIPSSPDFVCSRRPALALKCQQIRRGSFLPRLAFFTLGNLKAGCELTYDYGAAGSAGGAPEVGHEESFQSMPKAQRRTSPTDTIKKSPDSNTSSVNERAFDEKELAACLGGGRADTHCSNALRRLCLCGSRRCRGFLPCNRAVL